MGSLPQPEPRSLPLSPLVSGLRPGVGRPFVPLYRKLRETRVSLAAAAAAVTFAMAATIGITSLVLHPRQGMQEDGERTVYSYMLPTVYVQPEHAIQKNQIH
jgi:hypothetical protein